MKNTTMKHLLIALLSLSSLAGLTSCSEKATAANGKAAPTTDKAAGSKEQAFVAAFRTALEKKDQKTLDSFLLKDGTPAEIVEFFTMMMDLPAGMKIESVELATPTAEEAAKYNKAMEMPDGKSYKLPVTPTKQLVIIMKEEGANGSGTSKSSLPVAEKDGKIVIPLPVPAH
jgi:hypothetical protein